eukprot:3648154-Pyramimonas_sp.AAC.2
MRVRHTTELFRTVRIPLPGVALATLTALERAAIAVGTTVTAPSPGLLREHVEAAAARLGVHKIDVLCLEWEWDSGDVADNGFVHALEPNAYDA